MKMYMEHNWSYNNRGQMTAKTYADNSSVTYTYNGDGQLLTRTWARQVNGAPLVTTYSYDAAGRQTGYCYSDGTTPAVTQTLNFLDQPVTVTDAAGTRNFTYNADHRLVNETIPSIVNGMIDYTYDAYGRRTVVSFGNGTTSFANAAYSYDSAGRIATVGNSADTLTYTYMPGTNIIGSSAWQNATLNTVNTYDSYKRLTNIAVNGVNVYGYTLNDKNQRTGATLPDGRTWSYSYDTLGQLTGAVKRDNANTQLADLSYLYDQIGNRTSATENNTTTTYTSNLVNQYTQIASQLPTYDADGNMLTCNGWTFTWNGENRLIAAESSDTRLEFSYDYMGRRLEKKVYSKGLLTLYDWSLEKHRKFVYDGYKLIAEFEVEDDNATLFASYLWQPTGLDVPLMRIADNAETYYIADGNKNIIALKDSSGADVSTYSYTPFGVSENPADEDENPFRFSSEYADDETGLVYYNYRYYSPELGRWTKRDPIEEQGGVNLYGMVTNNGISLVDNLGYSLASELLFPTLDDVTDIPAIMRANGMFIGATLMEKWLSTPNSPTQIYDTSTVTIQWAKTFPRFLEVYNEILREKLYLNASAKKEIIKLSKKYNAYNAGGEFGSVSGNIISLDQEYIQHRPVGSLYDKNIDDMLAALGRFDLRVLVQGKVRAYKRRLFCLDKIGLYIRDSYDFNGPQFLGAWNPRTNYVGINPFKGYRVENESFREYRDFTGLGHDFIIFSDIEIHYLKEDNYFYE